MLAEVYSLLKRDVKNNNSHLNEWLIILETLYLKALTEMYIRKEIIIQEGKYREFGFTDIALLECLDDTNLLITNDFSLSQLCRYKGFEAYHLDELLF